MTPSAPFLREPIPVIFDEAEHTYRDVDSGRLYPGCTTVLQAAQKAWLAPWMLKECVEYIRGEWKPGETYTPTARDAILAAAKVAHKKKSTEAKDTGTDAHAIIEQIVACRMAGREMNHDLPKDEGSRNAVAAFLEWEEATKPEYLLSEQPMCSRVHWYAGKLDLVIKTGGMIGLVDVKTSKGIYPEYFAQLSAYQSALQEWTDERLAFRAVLRCPKDGAPFEWVMAPFSHEADFMYFVSCLEIHRWNQAHEARREGVR